jgi:transposase-like protein
VAKKQKRHWSRAFEARTDKDVKINISRVPPTLKAKFTAKCKREGSSQRNLILGWIRNYIEGRRPDEPSGALKATPDLHDLSRVVDAGAELRAAKKQRRGETQKTP